jgi:hypothetical protein
VVDCDPASIATYVERWEPEKRPPGYEAAKTAISNAMRSGQIIGKIVPLSQSIWSPFDETHHEEAIEDSINVSESRLEVASLKSWLADRGFTAGFFFPRGAAAPDYLDSSHPRYAPKLAAAIQAWRATENESMSGRSPKQALVKWLREHASEFGLSDEDGKPNETGIEEAAKVANWQPGGGAPKTPAT